MRRDADELDGFLEFLAGELSHPGLAALVARFLGDAEIRKALRELPAAETHHSYAGGLLEHTVGVATLARETAQLHPRLRADLLLAAALLHDVGRVRELGRGPAFRPTEEGRLLGHVHLGLRLVEERADGARPRRARRAPARDRLAPRPQRGPHGRGGRALPRKPARRRRGDQTRRLVLAIALALGASLSWGLGDFVGGLKSRSMHVLTVLVVSQVFGLAAALTWVVASGDGFPGWSATAWAAAAGVSGCVGIGTLYRGMAVGAMGVVAPISAVAAVIPFTVGIASGERPSALQVLGILLALVGRRRRLA